MKDLVPVLNLFYNGRMKVIFLDHDGVICLYEQHGGRFKKKKKFRKENPTSGNVPVEYRFDNFDKKCLRVLNSILEETGAEIVVSSDWWRFCNLEEMCEYYRLQGIIKMPIDFTSVCPIPPEDLVVPGDELEESRSWEINKWLSEHPEVTHWVAIDDLDLSKKYGPISGNFSYGIENFVLTPRITEGIKQLGIKQKVLDFLK